MNKPRAFLARGFSFAGLPGNVLDARKRRPQSLPVMTGGKAKRSDPKRHVQAPLSRSRKAIFALICLLLPFLGLLALEGVLRLSGLGGYPPILQEIADTPQGTLYISNIEAARSYFFANQERPGYNEQYSFYQPKREGVRRVLLVGGSAIKGYPQPRNLAPSAFLGAMLEEVWPDHEVEVLNLGTTAVASFPVMEMMIEGLAFDPDLVVVYSGHNEFFGCYGVASSNRAGSTPFMLKFQRRIRSLAVVQGLNVALTAAKGEPENKSLMEIMIGQSYTSPDHWSREAAAKNLHHHMRAMIRSCQARNIPIMVCTTPSNERDLAPIGEVKILHLPESEQKRLGDLLQIGMERADIDPEEALDPLRKVLEKAPDHARAHFYLGRALYNLDRQNEAHAHFVLARDKDSMPWRATSLSLEGIVGAARDEGAILCDVEAAFRSESPGGCIGWELMDDHVHPSLQGQYVVARALVEELTRLEGPLRVSEEAFRDLPKWEPMAEGLGDHPYSRYAVNHQMRVLFNVPFMKSSNPAGLERFNRRAREFEETLEGDFRKTARLWQSEQPHAGGHRPITGMMARVHLRRKEYSKALDLLRIAQRSVPVFTSWHMEYVYFELACREQLQAGLRPEDRQRALDEIERGTLLLSRGYSESGLAERYVGRLHQLRGEFAEAIPYLLAGRPKLHGFDVVATDQALFLSYLRTGQTEKARLLVENGIRHSGPYAEHYARMQSQIPGAEKARTEGEWFH